MRFHNLCIPCLRERVRKTVKYLSGKAEKVGETSSSCEPLLDTLRGGDMGFKLYPRASSGQKYSGPSQGVDGNRT
jgi:hypothetical protein